ncbi:MAG: aminoglycoside phosphotransferase family protein [Candidatus Izemoplasmatales bacterium]
MKKIGEGKTATVYSDTEYAYKKYHSHYDSNNIHYEVNVQNEIYHKTKLNVAKYEIIEDYIKMTLFHGVTLADRILVEHYPNWLKDFVDLQSQIYEYKDLDLYQSYPIYEKQIIASSLDETLKNSALESLASIDKLTVLCHFDFHPLNILYDNELYYIIDWTNAKLGHPAMDIASTYIIYRQFLPNQADEYLQMILEKTGMNKRDVLLSLPVMSFIKLRENEEPEQESLLISFIDKTDSIFY